MSGRQRVFPDKHALAHALAEEFVRQSRARAASGERFSVALAGGTTPRLLYEELARRSDEVPWTNVHFFWSDERAVPLDHADSNYRLAAETLFTSGRAPESNVHTMLSSPDEPEAAARAYEAQLIDILGSARPVVDWTLLGLGPDGHIASLFPGAPALREASRSVVVVLNSPKSPPTRLTVTLPFINRSAEIHIVVAGAEKAEAVHGTIEGGRDPDRWPAQRIAPANGTLTWWLDRAAASLLTST